MKTFVTGATGFLGSHLVDLLLQEGHEVRCLVRKTSDLRWLKNKQVRLIEGDLTTGNQGLREGLKDADWCFHSAGLISTTKPQEYFSVNVGGTRHCLEACLQVAPKLKKFVLVSSTAACGPSQEEGSTVDESTPPHPVTLYGQSKLEAEKVTLSFRNKLPTTILRPPAIYGPRDKMILPVFCLAQRHLFLVPGFKTKIIAMAYVEDVARSLVWAAKNEKAVGETFFITDGDIYRWEDVADVLAALFHHRIFRVPLFKSFLWPVACLEEMRAKLQHQSPKIHRGHVRQFYRSWGVRIDKIKTAGFTPRFHLEAGMKATVAGYRQLGWL